jgi:hypothetical protein
VDCSYLRLTAPLLYRPFADLGKAEEMFPGAPGQEPENGETLFRFVLNPRAAGSIEPAAGGYLERLTAAGELSCGDSPAPAGLDLPAGEYWFTQIRQVLDRAECVETALELQKEGLWQRIGLGTILYFRCLREDGSPVVQLFRPVERPDYSRTVSTM